MRSPWPVQHAIGLLVALHLPFVVAPPVYTVTRYPHLSLAEQAGVVMAAVALGGLQLRHTAAARQGARPRWWGASLLVTALLVYVPTTWFSWDWANTQWFVLASAAMLLRGRLAVAVVAGLVVGNAGLFGHTVVASDSGVGEAVFWTFYWVAILVMGGVALYGSARLVQVAEERHAARLELARTAVGRERLRVSRDLHDLLGQSLSAVSLKGDLALRLLPSDTEAARAEIQGLTELARAALRDVRAVTHGRHTVSLGAEVDAATHLLAAARIPLKVDVDPDLAGAVDPAVGDVLAWTVREGTTNLLRHSDPRACRLRAGWEGGVVALEIVNDGVRPETSTDTAAAAKAGTETSTGTGAGTGAGAATATGDDIEGAGAGSGLVGLGDRARALGGTVTAGRAPGGRFRLRVELPERPPLPHPDDRQEDERP